MLNWIRAHTKGKIRAEGGAARSKLVLRADGVCVCAREIWMLLFFDGGNPQN
jgi:hypothetical protein